MYIKNQNIVKREIHKEYFLINIKQNYLNDKCYLYLLNTMGNYIWDLLVLASGDFRHSESD